MFFSDVIPVVLPFHSKIHIRQLLIDFSSRLHPFGPASLAVIVYLINLAICMCQHCWVHVDLWLLSIIAKQLKDVSFSSAYPPDTRLHASPAGRWTHRSYSLVPRPHPRGEERVWWHSADSSAFIKNSQLTVSIVANWQLIGVKKCWSSQAFLVL